VMFTNCFNFAVSAASSFHVILHIYVVFSNFYFPNCPWELEIQANHLQLRLFNGRVVWLNLAI